jgi:hypothetical protein
MLLCCFMFLVQLLLVYFVGGLECVMLMAPIIFFSSDVWIRTQSAAKARGQKLSIILKLTNPP